MELARPGTGRVGALIYALSLTALYGASAGLDVAMIAIQGPQALRILQRTIETINASRFVGAPGVRIVPEGNGRTLVAWTGFDGAHFVVRAADFVNGHRATPQTVSPTGVDAVLGDAAARADGEATVAWRSGVLGADPAPGANPTLFASHRGSGQTSFGTPEQVSEAGENVPTAPSAALSAVSGRSFVVYAPLSAGVKVSSRP